MATLLDIAPAMETVNVGGVDVRVYGVALRNLTDLWFRFPQVASLFEGADHAVDALMRMSGEVVAAIIACGLREPGNAEYEAHAQTLALDTQAVIVAAILRVTFPRGVGPFVESLTGAASSLNLQSVVTPSAQSNGHDVAAATQAPN